MFEMFLSTYVSSTIRFLFLLAPFFVVSMFLALTRGLPAAEKASIIKRASISALILGLVLFFAGPVLFSAIGITLNSFRIGAGSLLFLTAISLVTSGTRNHATGLPEEERDDVAVVPLAIPVMIGPATIGAILVYGAELKAVPEVAGGLLGLLSGLLILAVLLHLSGHLEKLLGKTGLNILSKISGLILSAMAAEIVMTGVAGFVGSL
ncbi:MarC family protein [Marinobacter bryozoorum]|uniref:MarC family protein n=1 Tax=Marinobacter bryozoorum TaxID=256324 RepID=UPI0020029DD7|nr:MarC family protein [Marinobacter bryozoorum]MCK7542583.1 MarC family protein [Marinobacter bryozoorum]